MCARSFISPSIFIGKFNKSLIRLCPTGKILQLRKTRAKLFSVHSSTASLSKQSLTYAGKHIYCVSGEGKYYAGLGSQSNWKLHHFTNHITLGEQIFPRLKHRVSDVIKRNDCIKGTFGRLHYLI